MGTCTGQASEVSHSRVWRYSSVALVKIRVTSEDDLRTQAAAAVLALHGHVVAALVEHADAAVLVHHRHLLHHTEAVGTRLVLLRVVRVQIPVCF